MFRITSVLLASAFAVWSQTPPTVKLPGQVQPVRYALDLRLVPEEDTYSGSISIDVKMLQASSLIWINSTELKISKATVESASRQLPVTAIPGGREFVGLQLPEPVQAGPAKIKIDFSGGLNKNDVLGLFKQAENGRSYVLTQFEPTGARRAFPCFDEPSFKTPWTLTLHVPKAYVTAGNTPIASEQDEAGELKTVRFAESKPLPSYLVAIAVGPFDVVEGGHAGRNKVPLRILVPRGRKSDAAWATEVTPKILDALEGYFGVPYPYEKLDQATIPVTVSFGAMENAGLITYQQTLLLTTKEADTIEQRRLTAEVIAHELGHQWFGNMVTPVWWDDIWLNEAFATWVEEKIIAHLFPDWHVDATALAGKYVAMGKDSLLAARKIRQPIEHIGDIGNAFDPITYQKGSAVITMFEQYLGEKVFQQGVKQYMQKHAWGNATSAQFVAAISAAAGRDIGPAFDTFLNRGGVPLMKVDLQCGKGRTPSVSVRQERFLPLGSAGTRETYWQIPVCVEYSNGKTKARECVKIADPKDSIPLKSAKSCPEWINANPNASGYYHVSYEGDLFAKLTERAGDLNLTEKVDLLLNASALVRGGLLPADQALELVRKFKDAHNREVVEAMVQIVASIRMDVPPENAPKFAAFVRSVFSGRARQVGWNAKPGETADAKLLRRDLIEVAAMYGDDPDLIADAKQLAQAWLTDRKTLEPEIVDLVLDIAAANADRALFEQLVAAAKASQDRRERNRIIRALGRLRDPQLARASLNLVLSDELDVRETMWLLSVYLGERTTGPLRWSFLKENYETLLPRLPSRLGTHAGSHLPAVGRALCSEQGRKEVASFFAERIKSVPGGERTLAETLESITLCQARRSAQQPAIERFLSSE